MSGTNITRAEAAARSAIVQVQSYDVHVDLSGVRDAVATTFPSTTTVHFTATAGASTWIDLIAPRIQRATLNGTPLDAAGFDGFRLQLPALAGDNTLVVVADCATCTPARGCTASSTRWTDRPTSTRSSRRPTPGAMYACFDQPDLKATFAFTVTAPDDWEVVSNAADARA